MYALEPIPYPHTIIFLFFSYFFLERERADLEEEEKDVEMINTPHLWTLLTRKFSAPNGQNQRATRVCRCSPWPTRGSRVSY